MRILQEFLLTHDGIDEKILGIDSLKIVYRVRRNGLKFFAGENIEFHLGADDVAQGFVILLRPVCEVFDIKRNSQTRKADVL